MQLSFWNIKYSHILFGHFLSVILFKIIFLKTCTDDFMCLFFILGKTHFERINSLIKLSKRWLFQNFSLLTTKIYFTIENFLFCFILPQNIRKRSLVFKSWFKSGSQQPLGRCSSLLPKLSVKSNWEAERKESSLS